MNLELILLLTHHAPNPSIMYDRVFAKFVILSNNAVINYGGSFSVLTQKSLSSRQGNLPLFNAASVHCLGPLCQLMVDDEQISLEKAFLIMERRHAGNESTIESVKIQNSDVIVTVIRYHGLFCTKIRHS